MKKPLYQIAVAALTLVTAAAVFAKLPALSDEAKTKAAEAAAKTAWSGKVDGFQLCKAQDNAAGYYFKASKAAGKEVKPAAATPPCADPGPFVYTPAVAAPAAAAPAAEPAKKS